MVFLLSCAAIFNYTASIGGLQRRVGDGARLCAGAGIGAAGERFVGTRDKSAEKLFKGTASDRRKAVSNRQRLF